MKELVEKISSYNIFNYLFPGVVVALFSSRVSSFNLIMPDLATGVFVYYFYGLIVSRIGSIIIEPFLKKIKFIEYSNYKHFVQAEKSDVKVATLLEVSNMYRTLVSLFVCLSSISLLSLLESKFIWVGFVLPYGTVIFLLILFGLSYRKQTNYICHRVEEFINSTSGNRDKTKNK